VDITQSIATFGQRRAEHLAFSALAMKDPEPHQAPIDTPEAIGMAGGLSLTILGVLLKQEVLIGAGSSLTAAGLFSALVRKVRGVAR
jgi:hypothetical protein